MVIDDDRDFADSLSNLLTLEGYRVECAYSESEARTALEGFAAQLALVDIRLGEGSGIRLVGEFRHRQPDLLCVMMTAYASAETAIEALQSGAYDYLCKPFYTEDLLATLERSFERIALARAHAEAEAELRERNAELERSEERLRKIVENSPSAIALKDLDGSYLVVNKRFEEWHGLVRSRHDARALSGAFPAALAGTYAARESEVLERGRVIEQEVEIERDGEPPRQVLVTWFPVLDESGQPMGVGTIGTDTTERRRAEEQLRQGQKMEALGQLTGGVAHDFNNLLAVILGNLDLVEEELAAESPLRELIEDALESARSGVELTHRLLAFGRRQTLHPQPTDAGKLIAGMSRLLERALGETIEVEHRRSDGLWPIEIDPNQLETSLLNLAINARDAMPEGGHLTIETANAEVSVGASWRNGGVTPGQYVKISVTDSGEGMAPDVVERAIHPFFTTKEIGHGSGLGLSMVYGFVMQSEGHLQIDSEPGGGTTVALLLPRANGDPLAPADKPPPSAHSNGNGERILVVEDKPEVRKLASKILRRLGYDVTEAANARAALGFLESGPAVDLLFTDLVLPGGMNGIRLAEEATRQRPALKVLYTSGYAQATLERLAEPTRDFQLVRKPFRKDDLARMVRNALDA